jgi:hypothetical protein
MEKLRKLAIFYNTKGYLIVAAVGFFIGYKYGLSVAALIYIGVIVALGLISWYIIIRK